MATHVLPLVAEVGTELCRVRLEGGSMGGYRSDILTENLSEREVNTYQCPRCEGIMNDCVISNTGEQLCVCCLKEGEQSHFNAPIRKTILSLKCSCPLSKRGCDWLGTLESVEHHLTTCGRVHVSCELRCEVVTSRDGMGRHVREECSQREEACLHCSGVHKACEMEEHVKVCGKVEVMCELGCGTRVCRDSILRHRENECPEEIVVCPYEKYRCEVVGLKRREFEQHLEDNRILHLELKIDASEEDTQLKFNNLEEEIKIERKETELKHKSLVEKVESHTKQIEVLGSNLKSKDEEIASLKQEFLKGEITVKFSIKNISNCFEPNQGFSTQNTSEIFRVAGYGFSFWYASDGLDFNISFLIYSSLEWPLRAKFITRVVCHRDTKQSLILKSPIIELQRKDCHIAKKQICSIPLSTDLKGFIKEDSLYLEVTLRILKYK